MCCSGLWRAHLSRSTWKRSGLGVLTPSEGDFRVVSSDVSCRFTVSGHHSVRTNTYKSRNQSREAGTSSRIFGSVGTSAKYISLGPADYRKRVSNTVRVSPSQVHGGVVHRGGPPAGSGNGTRSESSVRERGHRICTSLQQGNRVLQPVLHSSKEGCGFASHFRSLSSERLRQAAQVKNVNFETNHATDQIRGLVCHDRSQGRILPHIHPSTSQEAPEVRFWGQSIPVSSSSVRSSIITRTFTKYVDPALVPLQLQGIRIMNYINDWMILAQSHQLSVRYRDVMLAHMKELGLRLNAKKSVLSPLQRTTFLGMVWDTMSMQSLASIESILSAVKGIRLGQSLTVKQFQRLLGLMAAASIVIPFGLLYTRPLQWWLRTKGFSPRGNPFCMIKATRRCFRALVMWKKPWFLSQGPELGASCSCRMLTTDASLTGWGVILEGCSSQGLWKDQHLSWHINLLEMLAVFLALKNFLADLRGNYVLVHSDNTSVVSYINHQGGLWSR